MTLFLYDPRTNILSETSYQYLTELSGHSYESLASMKSRKRKIRSINCYLADDKTTIAQRKEWYEKEIYHNELWKQVHGSDGAFLISNYGRFKRVYLKHTGFLLPFLHKKSGHLHIKVMFNGIYKAYKVSQLVAFHYVGMPKPGQVLHHKNEIITDDYFANLEYIDKSKLGKKTGYKSKSKPVVQLDLKTLEVIDEFRSAREAGRKCFLSYQAILDNCNHKTKTSGGYIFMFLDEYEEIDIVEGILA
ncbi:NUMOD4 domain-containing protein [Heyndrickxia sp. FSL W8-0423]|uniref:NUMOD4 domain-containing protein n=1 Tax=Heyndrickxia sp. FSL W8-0423 TaxID=2921601 RepID=UPI0030F9192C